MEETIKLIVEVRINYPDKTKRKEAINRAKECAVSASVLGTVGCCSKSAKIYKKDQFDKAIEDAFKKGESWGVTYSTWFAPTEEDTKKKMDIAKKSAFSILTDNR